MTNDELHELIAAYALDALAADDREAFESHLSGCEQCRADLAELSQTVGVLARAAEGPAPPEGLRDRIVLAARAEGPSNVVALRPRRLRLYAGAAAALAASAALAIGLTFAFSGGGKTQTVALRGATGKLVWHSNQHATLTVTDLPAAPAGKIYEVWVLAENGTPPARGALFQGGPGDSVVQIQRPLPAGGAIAVTVEKAGGVDAPTGKPILSAFLTPV